MARSPFRVLALLWAGLFLLSCGVPRTDAAVEDSPEEPRFLRIEPMPNGGHRLISISPFDGSHDTLYLENPLERLIVMSTSHIGFLQTLNATEAIVGVSGKDYVYREASEPPQHSESINVNYPMSTIVDIGYDAAPDYERILSLKPDLLLTYTVSAAKSPFLSKLEQLGVRVFIVNEHLESHPLARAGYVRLFGALTGKMEKADSVLAFVRASYSAIAASVSEAREETRKVLLNIPYNDQWFVPSEESYLTRMILDAGGEVLGSKPGRAASSLISVEGAYSLCAEADCWLNVGWCQNMDQLLKVNPIFPDMVSSIRKNAVAAGIPPEVAVVWNDNKRLNAKGGNDIWQSGVARPDLVLRDLASILHPSIFSSDSTIYYRSIIK